ncbi:anthranilate synthase component II [Neobacillus mesonae]|uniref:Aminodeoxychorismate/anthranilate synthase component II n=1 Tax=Neobacillus mesonae TaxID=1193713 RepID=A0A3T0I0Y2_9BACI|nr:aminodeoxychorismate/anthranilate synthase component II [Neobacillus mesonae]AZU63000.1 aminodeoxychorismate/anthranilate synthase component II [Neobacillus mesonae]
MILLIDNFDSFTFNLYQYLGEIGEKAAVHRNNQITIEEIDRLKPKAIILSPGAGRPEDAGICLEVIQRFYQKIPILGICLGHQAIGAAFGGEIRTAKTIKHGKISNISHNSRGVFANLTSPIEVMRYHSLSIDKDSLPSELECTAHSTDDHEIMAVKHIHHLVYGLQFHPESIGTPEGKQMLRNFLAEIERTRKDEELFTPVS